ncbi:MAG: serpin family protein [Actinomycetota bacterium]|nr:serpin family protein [Actinomycetota bacterium]
MLTRRDLLRDAGALGTAAAAGPLLSGCTTRGGRKADPVPAAYTRAGYLQDDVAAMVGSPASATTTARSLSAFTTELYAALSGAGTDTTNLVCSPYSVAAGLAMTRAGARGSTGQEIDHVLHATGPGALADGMSRLRLTLDQRTGRRRRVDQTLGTVSIDAANSVWAQHGTWWRRAFLLELAGRYGAGMNLVDFIHAGDAAAKAINEWTATTTRGRVKQIVPPGLLDRYTRMVLVNAIWLKAPWEEVFDPHLTKPAEFHTAAGGRVRVPMMSRDLTPASYAVGPGWQAASLPYAGRDLALAIVVPDAVDGLPKVHQAMSGGGLAALLDHLSPHPVVKVAMPRWSFTTNARLDGPLKQLGMPTAFSSQADFTAMCRDERLRIGAVAHRAFVAVDEHGTEAAAATAVVMQAMSGQAGPVPSVRADRPFLFALYDVPTKLVLFLGRVGDPTVTT